MNENNMKTPAQPNAKPAPDSLSQQAASALQQSMQGFAAELAQQQESDLARETIRVLRMELSQLTEQYQQQISELEQRVTEFKLKFEYAQRQLSATS